MGPVGRGGAARSLPGGDVSTGAGGAALGGGLGRYQLLTAAGLELEGSGEPGGSGYLRSRSLEGQAACSRLGRAACPGGEAGGPCWCGERGRSRCLKASAVLWCLWGRALEGRF